MQVDLRLLGKRRDTGRIHRPQYHHHTFDALLLCRVHQKMHIFLSMIISLNQLVTQVHVSLTFDSISSLVSVRNMDDVGSDALIFDCGPCRAGKKIECSSAGL